MKKTLYLLLTVITFFALLTSCAKKTMTNEQLKSDLQPYLNSFFESNVSIEELKILNRQTDTSAKSDSVSVEIKVKNEDIEGVLSYTMNYHLYDQGWTCETATRNYQGTWNITPLRGPKQEIANALVTKKYSGSDFDYKEESLENNKSTFYYINGGGKTKYTTFSTKYSLEFTFDAERGIWEAGEVKTIGKKYEWDITGTWYPGYNQYSSSWYNGYEMTISNVGDKKLHAQMSKDGEIYFDEDVPFDNVSGAHFTVETSSSSWDDINMVISPDFIGAKSLGTRSGCSFERE